MPKVLIVDDDRLILESFRYAFPPEQIDLLTATSVAEAIALFQQQAVDAVVADIRLPDSSGVHLLQTLKAIDRRVPVILMTGHGTSNSAIEATRNGAFEYLLKPLNLDTLQSAVERALEASRICRTPARIAGDSDNDEGMNEGDYIVGQCPAMQEVYRQIGRVAGLDVAILILGETGTGKEVVARAIVQYSQRAEMPFLAINCAAIPENLLESELFGHERGSFTGAERQRIGKFEQCHGGTLFLDEIGDMTPMTQTKVLRILQDQRFERVGGNERIQTDVRLIAATNRNLNEMIEGGTFRSDLYYRLNVYIIQLPPLRERDGDLPLLVDYFLKRFSCELNKQVQGVSETVMDVLQNYSWPGNLRELQSVLKHAVVESTGPVILPECLPESLRRTAGRPMTASVQHDHPEAGFGADMLQFIQQRLRAGSVNLYDEVITRVERILLTELLEQVDGNLSRAAAILGISRSTLRVKLTALEIVLERTVRKSD